MLTCGYDFSCQGKSPKLTRVQKDAVEGALGRKLEIDRNHKVWRDVAVALTFRNRHLFFYVYFCTLGTKQINKKHEKTCLSPEGGARRVKLQVVHAEETWWCGVCRVSNTAVALGFLQLRPPTLLVLYIYARVLFVCSDAATVFFLRTLKGKEKK